MTQADFGTEQDWWRSPAVSRAEVAIWVLFGGAVGAVLGWWML